MQRRERQYSHDDPLYNWKKHSGFKMGLLTDIVLGDAQKFSGSQQYISTMHFDYVANPLSGAHGGDSTTNVAVGHVVGQQGTVGPPLAPASSRKSEMHIVFGDPKMSADERSCSMTDSDFRAPPPGTKRPIIVKPGVSTVGEPGRGLTTAQMFHTKAATATSAAHIGLQTRQDLPIDDIHFRSFVTTTQDSYLPKDTIDVSMRHLEGVSRVNPGRPSHIHLGDLEKQKSYDTVHATSFVRHPSNAYRTHSSCLPSPSKVLNSLLEQGREADRTLMYSTTASAAYQGIQPEIDAVPNADSSNPANQKHQNKSQKSGTSNIVFGEDGPERRRTHPSVTQHDYCAPKKLLDSDHLQATGDKDGQKNVKDDTSSALNNWDSKRVNEHGILKALWPDDSKRDIESYTASSFRPYNHSEAESVLSAGVRTEYGKPALEGINADGKSISSVPTGDSRHYNFQSYDTTTMDAFRNTNWACIPSHPVLGAKMTQSKVTFGDLQDEPEGAIAERYTSTAHRAFVRFSEEEARHVRGLKIDPHHSMRTSSDMTGADEFALDGQYETTHQAHFSRPSNLLRCMARPPKPAAKSMLFPLRASQPGSYETTTQDCFSMREGLVGDQIAYAKHAKSRDSSIVFGDNTRFGHRPALPSIVQKPATVAA